MCLHVFGVYVFAWAVRSRQGCQCKTEPRCGKDGADNPQSSLLTHTSLSLGLCIYVVVIVEYSICLALLPPGQMTLPDLWLGTPSHAM